MIHHRSRIFSIVRAAPALVVLALGTFGSAVAQSEPAAAPPSSPPSYATPSNDEQIRGTISAVPGKYALLLRDRRGFVDSVALHQGTVINPTGLKLQPGMEVAIAGKNSGATFDADVIDVPGAMVFVAPPAPDIGLGFGWGPRARIGGFWW